MSATRYNDLQTSIAEATRAMEPHLVAIRRDIHAHPELGFEEVRTAGVVAAELVRLGIPHQTGVGRTGVVATITGGRPGATLAIRADMDALPIHEQSGLPFASVVPGAMHACGHDIHTTVGLDAAMILFQLEEKLSAHVRFLFQLSDDSRRLHRYPPRGTDGGGR